MGIASDLRFSSRTLVKNPAFSITAVAALALGIGTNTAVFSVVNQVLLNPAGVSEPTRVAALRVKYGKAGQGSLPVSLPDFADVQKATNLFESAAVEGDADYNYTGSGLPERLHGSTVTAGWFDVFGAKPRIGRVFRQEEDQANANQVVVLSFAAWKRLFGQDPGVLERTIELNQKPYRVIGVMGPDFRWPVSADLWAPLGLLPAQYGERNRFNEAYDAFVRLKPGVKFAEANAYLEVLNDRLRNLANSQAKYARQSKWGMFLSRFTDYVAGDTKTPMLILLGAVGLVLLIACSNIAGLMLARASARIKEVAVRAALGASRWTLIRMALSECLVLVIAGSAAGLALSLLGVRLLMALAPQNAPFALSVRVDPTMILFTVVVAVVSAILLGIAPAWQMSHSVRHDALKEGGRSGMAGTARQRLRAGLVIGQVALSLMLLVCAGLLLRSLEALRAVSPGFRPDGVITAQVALPSTRYADVPRQVAFYHAALEQLSRLPGVTNVAAGFPAPFSGKGGSASFQIEGKPVAPGEPNPHGDLAYVTPDYFSSLRIPLRSGRVFNDQDALNAELTVVIDEALAHLYWPNENPVGKHMHWGGDAWWNIIGVVGHVKHSDLAGDATKGKYYLPIYQRGMSLASFLVRTQGDPSALGPAIRAAIQTIDPTQAASQIRTMPEMLSESLAPRRFVMTSLGGFAVMALLMAVIGLYGMISYSVAQRTQEIGVRVALGAQRPQIVRMVVGQGLRIAGIGVGIGLAGSLTLSGFLRSELFHISPFDPITFGVTALALVSVACAASYLPALRATRIDPMEALRYE